jgi:hypothetical protein
MQQRDRGGAGDLAQREAQVLGAAHPVDDDEREAARLVRGQDLAGEGFAAAGFLGDRKGACAQGLARGEAAREGRVRAVLGREVEPGEGAITQVDGGELAGAEGGAHPQGAGWAAPCRGARAGPGAGLTS